MTNDPTRQGAHWATPTAATERVPRAASAAPGGRCSPGVTAAVDRDPDAAEDRNAQRAAELRAGLGDPEAAPAPSGGAEPTMSSVVRPNTGAKPSEMTDGDDDECEAVRAADLGQDPKADGGDGQPGGHDEAGGQR